MQKKKRILLLDDQSSALLTILRKLENELREVTDTSSMNLCDAFDVIAATPPAWRIGSHLASGYSVNDMPNEGNSYTPKELLRGDQKTDLCWLAPSTKMGVTLNYWYRTENGKQLSSLTLPNQQPENNVSGDVSYWLFQLLLSGGLGFAPAVGEKVLLFVVVSGREIKGWETTPGELSPPTLRPFLARNTSRDFLHFPKTGIPDDDFTGSAELLTLLRYRTTASDQLEDGHLAPFFAQATGKGTDLIRFKADQRPDLPFKKAVKKAIPIEVCEIDQPFIVETMEGPLGGKAGDFLMIGIQGEMYPCDREIFFKTYEFLS